MAKLPAHMIESSHDRSSWRIDKTPQSYRDMKAFLAIVAALAVASRAQNPRISTPLGEILGSTLTTRLNRTIYAFRGVRYAQPPVGDLRFKAPVAVERWTGVYNATADGPACPQPSDDPVSEDCLLLNVYTTKLPDDDSGASSKRPVIVYLHAGGFYSVTGRSNWEGPQYLLDQDIVLVTLNYRLGSLGFLSVGKDAPGNFGLKDQVLALKWVKNNIKSFGGDPDSVTLFGYSAGSWSITLHLVSPISRGLFHRAILGSGSVLGQWELPRSQLDVARKQAKYVGCPENDTVDEILNCLKTVPAEDLGNSLENFPEFLYDPVFIWYPVIEEDFGQERFLSEDPIEMYERGDFAQVPIVMGVTKDEFANRAFILLGNETALGLLSEHFETYAPIAFLYERGTERSREISSALKDFYSLEDPLTNASLSRLADLYADSIIGFSVNRAVNVVSGKSSAPVYYYEFTYQGRFSHFYLPDSNGTQPYGVVHHDDLIYLFYISALFPFFSEDYPESGMVETLTTLWATFAATGNPVPNSHPRLGNVTWNPYTNDSQSYLEIGSEINLKSRLYERRYSFWDFLIPIPSYQRRSIEKE